MNTTWVEYTWGDADFGDARLNARCQQIGQAVIGTMEGTIPKRSQSWAATKATYRFLDNPNVDHEVLQERHWQLVMQEALAEEGVVLWVQDGSELLYNSHYFLAGCGPTADGEGNGLLMHTCLAVRWTSLGGALIGVGYQMAWTRGKGSAAQRSIGTKESEVWAETLKALGPVPDGHTWVTVCDRGADCYAFFNDAIDLGWKPLVRLCQNRTVEVNGVSTKLFDYARSLESRGSSDLELRARGDQGKRTVTLHYASGSVVLPVPNGAAGCRLTVNVVRIWGEDLEWILLTTLPTDSFEDLKAIGRYYEQRWVIEEYHKSLKTGLKIETAQLRTAQRILNLLGILGVVAAQMLILRDQARTEPDRPASDLMPDKIIEMLRRAKPRLLSPIPSVREVVRAIASLGGFLGRKGDGEPGWITVWKGWLDIQRALALGA